MLNDAVNHPAHYGGEDNSYEAIKVIEAWELGFCLGNTVKYICRAGKKRVQPLQPDAAQGLSFILNRTATVEDLKKARWYLDREIQQLEKELRA